MKFFVYVIKSKLTDKIYVGYTNNLEIRTKRHNQKLPNKKSSFTSKNKGPWEIVYQEEFLTSKEAKIREKQLKSARGRKFVKEVILGR